MKNRIEIIKLKALPLLKKYDVVKAGIFGSYARGDYKKNSDIDMLIEFKGEKSLFDLVRLERELNKLLKRDIDLLTYNSINHLLKERILKEEVRIL
jgi:uncharacterized protein